MAYQAFAEVYDRLMEDLPYGQWRDYLVMLLKENGVRSGLVCELGCGTGRMTELLAREGYDMTGIDLSEEMLSKALEKRDESDLPILYLCQDMTEFELYGTMRAFVSVCDSMNYIESKEDFISVLKLVNNYLDPSGVFIFDLKTAHYYKDVLANRTIAYSDEDLSYIWENRYDEEDRANDYAITFFKREENGLYRRFTEEQTQFVYSLDEIRAFAKSAGMEFVEAFDAFTKDPVRPDSERIYIILKEKGKERGLLKGNQT